MGIRMVGKKEFQDAKSLCESCNNAVPQMCPFIKAAGNYEAVLEKMGAEAVKTGYDSNKNKAPYYKVVRCPMSKPGSLPKMAEAKHEAESGPPEAVAKRYDLSCPMCGEVKGVRIAWAKYLEPELWYCRCDRCKHGFKPRKRGCENVTLRDDFYKVMTKEKYLGLRAQGITSDAKVLAAVELPYNSFIKFLTEAKKKWGVSGKSVIPLKKQEEAGAGEPGRDEAGDNAVLLKGNQNDGAAEKRDQGSDDTGEDSSPLKDYVDDLDPTDDDDEVTFITPFKPIDKVPVLRFCDKGITLNVAAARLLGEARLVRVGVTKGGVIVLVASDKAEGCYALGSKNKAGGLKIGGGGLVRSLKGLGAKVGSYELEVDIDRARFEARKEIAR